MDDVIRLVTYGEPTYDKYGNEFIPEEKTQVFCRVDSVSRSEFYQAGQNGLKPEIVFTLSSFWDYAGQKLVRHADHTGTEREYTVIRTYRTPDGGIEITCEERIANGSQSSRCPDEGDS